MKCASFGGAARTPDLPMRRSSALPRSDLRTLVAAIDEAHALFSQAAQRNAGTAQARRGRATGARAGRLHQFLCRRCDQSVRRAGRARALDRHAQGCRDARFRRLRHARLRPHAEGGDRRAGRTSGDGQRDDAELSASCASRDALKREIGQTRGGIAVHEIPLPQLGFRSGRRWPAASPTSMPSC